MGALHRTAQHSRIPSYPSMQCNKSTAPLQLLQQLQQLQEQQELHSRPACWAEVLAECHPRPGPPIHVPPAQPTTAAQPPINHASQSPPLSIQIWKACPNARFPYSYKASCDLDTPDACNAVSHCTWRDSALKCSIQDQGVLAFLYKSPENARNLVSQARTCAAITNWKKCDQLTSSPMKVVPTVVNRPPRPPPPPPKGAATVSRAAGLNGAANIGSANGTSSMKAANMSVMQTMPTDAMKGTMQQSAVKTNGAQQQAAGLQLLAAAALAVLLAL